MIDQELEDLKKQTADQCLKDVMNLISKYELENLYEVPAYDLGYLLRKLQNDRIAVRLTGSVKGSWDCFYPGNPWHGVADTPEDATCSLAINLFQEGMLTRE